MSHPEHAADKTLLNLHARALLGTGSPTLDEVKEALQEAYNAGWADAEMESRLRMKTRIQHLLDTLRSRA